MRAVVLSGDIRMSAPPLLSADAGAGAHPVLWARAHGGGRVVYDALGHHPPSNGPEHREVARRALAWAGTR